MILPTSSPSHKVEGWCPMTKEAEYLTPRAAAALLSLSVATLAVWRSQSKGPRYSRVGGRVRYPKADLVAWVESGEEERQALESSALCHHERKHRTKRLRGRAGAAQRARRLKAEPFCRDCRAHDILIDATEVDHIIPLSRGGLDTDDNVRCLCRDCHKMRTNGQWARGKLEEIRARQRKDRRKGL